VQTYRQKDRGDTIFLETVGSEGTIRIAIPQQADALKEQIFRRTGLAPSQLQCPREKLVLVIIGEEIGKLVYSGSKTDPELVAILKGGFAG
jgi:hypothetical protein